MRSFTGFCTQALMLWTTGSITCGSTWVCHGKILPFKRNRVCEYGEACCNYLASFPYWIFWAALYFGLMPHLLTENLISFVAYSRCCRLCHAEAFECGDHPSCVCKTCMSPMIYCSPTEYRCNFQAKPPELHRVGWQKIDQSMAADQ